MDLTEGDKPIKLIRDLRDTQNDPDPFDAPRAVIDEYRWLWTKRAAMLIAAHAAARIILAKPDEAIGATALLMVVFMPVMVVVDLIRHSVRVTRVRSGKGFVRRSDWP